MYRCLWHRKQTEQKRKCRECGLNCDKELHTNLLLAGNFGDDSFALSCIKRFCSISFSCRRFSSRSFISRSRSACLNFSRSIFSKPSLHCVRVFDCLFVSILHMAFVCSHVRAHNIGQDDDDDDDDGSWQHNNNRMSIRE